MPRPSHRRALRAVVGVSAVALVTASLATPAVALDPLPGETATTHETSTDLTTPASVPDGNPGCSGGPGGTLDLPVLVPTVPAGVVTDVAVSLGLTQDWLGDLAVDLVSPDGTVAPVVRGIGKSGPTSCADSSNLAGTYVFSDRATLDPVAEAAAIDGSSVLPAGDYRPFVWDQPDTSVMAGLAGVTWADPTTPWLIRLSDLHSGDVFSVDSAALVITVDTLPDLSVAGPPNGTRLATVPTYPMSSTDPALVGFECSVDGGAFETCTSPFVPAGVAAGEVHTVRFRSLDARQTSEVASRTFYLRDVACEKATKKLAKAKKAKKKAVKALKKATKTLKALKKKDASKAKIKKAAKKVKKAKKVKTSKGKALGKAKRGFTSAC